MTVRVFVFSFNVAGIFQINKLKHIKNTLTQCSVDAAADAFRGWMTVIFCNKYNDAYDDAQVVSMQSTWYKKNPSTLIIQFAALSSFGHSARVIYDSHARWRAHSGTVVSPCAC